MGIVVALDGPAGAGKSSTAKEVARQLHFLYIDTGAMYRAVTLAALRAGISISDTAAVVEIARHSEIRFERRNAELHTFLNGEDVSAAIRSVEVAQWVSPVSAIAEVREQMVAAQREMGIDNDIVMEGRDIGTHVFPQAQFKFYLNADVRIRARRRIHDYQRIGQSLSEDEIVAELRKRDRIDSSRQHSPLRQAEGAIVVDTTDLRFEEQVGIIVNHVRSGLQENR